MLNTKTVFITLNGKIMHKITVFKGAKLDKDWVQSIRPDLASQKYRIEYVK